MSEDDGTAVAVLIGEEQARRALADPDEIPADFGVADGLLYVGPCCPDDVQDRGNDMVALTCHCGEPCALECGLCARCGSHSTWRSS